MTSIIGFEGNVRDHSVVVWGAAALSSGESVRNAITGTATSLADAERLRDEGHLEFLKRPIAIEPDEAELPLIVVMVRRDTPTSDFFFAHRNRLSGMLTAKQMKPWIVYVFADRPAFETYAAQVKSAVVDHALHSQTSSDHSRDAVRTALILAPADPVLNAFRAFQSSSNPAIERVARASVRSEFNIRRFNLMLSALRGEGSYKLKYDGGVAQGGGLDVDVASTTLDSVKKAHRELAPVIQRDFGLKVVIPPARLHELKAASAELHFVTTVPQRSLADRVARYLSLYYLQEVLSGRMPELLSESPELLEAARQIARPSVETAVTQTSLAEVAETVANPEPPTEARQLSDVLKVVGMVSGLQKGASEIEITLAPQFSVFVSATNNGLGETPEGAHTVENRGTFLRQPCSLWLVREVRSNGTERFWLRRLRLLNADSVESATALPSAVVSGAFLLDQFVSAGLNARGDLVTSLGHVSGATLGTHDSGQMWIRWFSGVCRARELEFGGAADARWLPPHPKPSHTPLSRLLLELLETDGAAALRDLLKRIKDRFNVIMLRNNSLREVRQHPTLLAYDGEREAMTLTAEGLATAKVLAAILSND